MDPGEIEFLAEKEHVTILPNFTEKKIFLIGVSLYDFFIMSIISKLIK